MSICDCPACCGFLAGTVGGATCVITGQPFDVLKVRLQSQDTRAPKYAGALHCFKLIMREERILGLFKGMSSPLFGAILTNAFVFGVYNQTMVALKDSSPLQAATIAGMAAGLANSPLTGPLELAKIRMQNQTTATHSLLPTTLPHFNSPIAYMRHIAKLQGVRGVFLGTNATFLRDTPSFGVYFLVYEYLTRNVEHTPPYMLAVGAMAGSAAWLVTYPLDVVKTKIQANDFGTYKGVWDCLKRTFKAEGHAGLWRGVFPTIIRAIPTNAATFTAYHYTLKAIERYCTKNKH